MFTLESRELAEDYYNENNNNNNNNNGSSGADISVTSRALAFTGLWTAALALIMAFVGTVVLGVTGPTGKYYWCCSGSVHRTTPLSLGTFVGSLLMFANLTLVCAVLFGEFKIRDRTYRGDGDGEERDDAQEIAVERSSLAFSIMCIFLTIMYGSYAALVYTFSEHLLEENEMDMRKEALRPSYVANPDNTPGFIGGERFDIHSHNAQNSGSTLPGGFIKPDHSQSGELT